MWFRTKAAVPADITAAQLRAEFAECKASVRALELEWERTYAKLRGIVARMSRKSGELGDEQPATPASPGNTLPMTQSQLSNGGRAQAPHLPRRNY